MAIGRRCTRLPVPRGAAHAALAWTAACSAAVGLTPAESESSKTEPSTTLQTVKERGTLRFVVCGPPNERLPRAGLSEARDRQVAETVAATLGVEAEFIRVADPDRLCQALDEGRGDVVIERHATLAERSADFRRSRPVRLVAEVLIGRKQAGRVRSIEDLSGSTIHVAAGTRHVRTVQEFLSKRGEVDVTLEFVDRPVESMAADVNAGTIDWTVVDSDRLAEFRRYLPEIAPAFEIAAERPVSWVLRSDDEALAAAVDKALAREGVLARPPVIATGDLDEIRKRGELRVLTRNHEISYFVHRGRRFGLDYELMREFAKSLGVRLVMIVPPRRDLMIDWLLEGRGDLIAASFTETSTRSARVAFSEPYLTTREFVVGNALDVDVPASPEGLQDRQIHVAQSSSYYESLSELRPIFGPYEVIPTEEELETTFVLDRVADDHIPLTVADGHILQVKRSYEPNVRGLFPLPDPDTLEPATKSIGFAVRPDNPKLLARVNHWLGSGRGQQMKRVMQARYLENLERHRSVAKARSSGRISPYDAYITRAAQEHGIDWRLMAAQAFVESRFDPTARSWAGAVGLFQVLPTTARSLGYEDIEDPAVSARAAAHYMRRLIGKFNEPDLPYRVRVHFALAAYNAGYGHVLDARKLARQLGLDANLWFDNVEKAMLLLARPKYHQQARYGYCRGKEPVRYVRKIQTLYETYTDIAQG